MTKENIRSKNVIKFIADEVTRGMGWSQIARDLYETFEISTSYHTVRLVYNEFLNKALESDTEFAQEAGKQIVNIKEQLTKINTITNELLDKYKRLEKENPNVHNINVLIALMREIKEQIAIQQRLTESLVEAKKTVNVSNIYLTKVMVQNLKEWESQGMIKIIKLPTDEKAEEKEESEEELEKEIEN